MDCREIVVKVEYDEDDIYTMVYVALINKKDASTVLEMFCTDIPLQNYGLNHLKRIQPLDRNDKTGPLQIVVCPVKSFDEVPVHVRDICKDKRAIKVAKLAPACRPEFEAWNKCWPINFHASHLEKQREKGLSNDDMNQVNIACQILAKEEETISSAAVMINPDNGKMVTCSSEAIVSLHKRLHSQSITDTCSICCTSDKIKERITYKDRDAYSELYTATMLVIEGVAAVVRGDVPEREDSLPPNAYLCSGLDLYLTYEPDLMASMALVHSRIRRVFYRYTDNSMGALESGRGHIHCLRVLNHNYRVFQLLDHTSSSSSSSSSSSTATATNSGCN